MLYWLTFLVFFVVLFSLRIVKEYERGVKFTLGKYVGVMPPGLRMVIPIIQSWQRVDLRVKAVDVPSQECISKDNVSLKVNAVLYYNVRHAEKAILEVEHYRYAVSQIAQTTMRNIIGEFTLDEILQNREKISRQIQKIVDADTDPWGIIVDKIELKDVELPADLKRVISKEAEAEREKRAVIIKASGEVIAAKDMAKAAKMLAASNGALHLRTLQTINEVSSDQNKTILFPIPLEFLEAWKGKKK